jgi:hypothetical protein
MGFVVHCQVKRADAISLELDAVEQLREMVEQMKGWLLKVDEARNTHSEDGSGSFTIEVRVHACVSAVGVSAWAFQGAYAGAA